MGILGLNVGDRVIVNLPVYRKPWQFWKPRIVGYKRWSLALTEPRLRAMHQEEERYYKMAGEMRDAGRASSAAMREMHKLMLR